MTTKPARIAQLSSAALSLLVQIDGGADLMPRLGCESLCFQELRRRGFVAKTERNPDLGKVGGWRWVTTPDGKAEIARTSGP